MSFIKNSMKKLKRYGRNLKDMQGNKKIIKDKTGLITDKSSCLEFYDEDISLLKISTVYPFP